MRLFLVSVLALQCAVPAMAQAPAAQTTAGTTGDIDEAKEICVRTSQAGSRVKRRLCLTEAEWELVRRRAQETGEKWQDTGNRNPVPDGT